MKVVLINAPTPGYELQAYPPLQLGYLAAALRDTGRHEVMVIDLGIEKMSDGDLEEQVKRADICGVYFVTLNWREGMRLIRLAHCLGVVTLAGGPHAGLNPEQVLSSGELDYAFIGEAEDSLVELLDALEAGDSPSSIAGIAYIKDGKPWRTRPRGTPPRIQEVPWPARDLLPMEKYRARSSDTSVLASRGCPYNCKFCAIKQMTKRRYRKRKAVDVVDEMENVVLSYGFERITFFDDIFTVDKKYAVSLCREMRQRQIKLPWSCETRVDAVDVELLTTMREAGCDQIFFGVESGSQRILDSLRKGTTVDQIVNAIQMAKAADIRPVMSVIVGSPEDDEESIKETIELVQHLSPFRAWFQPFAPFPGTDVVSELGDLLEENWLELYDNLDLRSPVIGTKYLSLKQVQQLYLQCMLATHDDVAWHKEERKVTP